MKVAYIVVKGERPKWRGSIRFSSTYTEVEKTPTLWGLECLFNDQEWEAAKTLGARYQDDRSTLYPVWPTTA